MRHSVKHTRQNVKRDIVFSKFWKMVFTLKIGVELMTTIEESLYEYLFYSGFIILNLVDYINLLIWI